MAKDLEGKVFLVTGATDGIGKAAALAFAGRGATLVIVGRSREKSEAVARELSATSGNDRVELLLGDLSKIADTRAVADAFREKYDRLDVLVNNAGAVFQDHKLSADGIEMSFALNHMGYFVLTTRLLDLIEKTPNARVVSTSSDAHMMAKMNLDTIVKRNGSAGFAAYGDSKLANILFTRELAKRIAPSGATANCIHPGFVRSAFGTNNGVLSTAAIKILGGLFARSPEKGAETIVWLATSDDAKRYTGEYFHDCKLHKTTRLAKDDVLAKKLWELSEQLCA